MPKYQVKLDVDGEEYEEHVNAPDCKLAMSKALKLHPIKVLSITPEEQQLDLDAEHHPGQTRTDDFGVPVDPGMEAVADALAGEGGGEGSAREISNADAARLHAVASTVDPEAAEREKADLAGEDDDFGLGS